jgi:hypothetical protein
MSCVDHNHSLLAVEIQSKRTTRGFTMTMHVLTKDNYLILKSSNAFSRRLFAPYQVWNFRDQQHNLARQSMYRNYQCLAVMSKTDVKSRIRGIIRAAGRFSPSCVRIIKSNVNHLQGREPTAETIQEKAGKCGVQMHTHRDGRPINARSTWTNACYAEKGTQLICPIDNSDILT